MKIQDFFHKKQVIFFIDSEIAKYAPSCLATKKQFVNILLQSLNPTIFPSQLKQWCEQHFEDFNEILYQELGKDYLKVFEIFRVQELNSIHLYLAHLIAQQKISVIVNLGWDNGVELALKGLNLTEGKDYHVINEKAQLSTWNWENAKPVIFKLRGSFENIASLAESFEIYQNGLGSERLDFVAHLLRKYYSIFLGMDGVFPYLHHYILETLPCSCPGMAVVEQTRNVVKDIERAINLYGHKIEIIEESADNFLKKLAESAGEVIPNIQAQICLLPQQNRVVRQTQEWANKITETQRNQVLARLFEKSLQYDQAILHRQAILSASEATAIPAEIAEAQRRLGNLSSKEPTASTFAIESFQKALDIAQKNNLLELLAHIYSDVGRMHFRWQRWNDSLQAYSQSLQRYELLGNKISIAKISGYIASIYEKLGDFVKATEYCQKSIDIYEKEHLQLLLARGYHQLGQIYFYQKNIARSKELYYQAQELSWKHGDIATIARIYTNLAIIEQQNGDFFNSQRLYWRAGVILERIGELNEASLVYYNLALLKYSCNDLGGTTRYLQHSYILAEACRNSSRIKKLRSLSQELEHNNTLTYAIPELWTNIGI